ncbi:hypothetical protein GRF29_44g228828 [Pseudopithomyces chartarum]|uniref:Uncharacterized protein n=1 Tax=Pseudopithomyces chartarum TaxID=1892770 RepID=A0AAN6LZJ5_9PLEO|nr:hypothetical protein GRF29_44g228828 [Pseudopithomyces chartarum]
MFSSAAGRVARAPATLPPPSVCAFARPAALAAAQQPFVRPGGHQRRLSSSKASIPPDGSNANGSSSAQQASARKVTGRAGRKRSAATPPAMALNVPHVPPTDYLQKPEVKISSFFSLHRPISLDHPIPPVATKSSFESIFTPRSPFASKTTVENIQTLSSGIESLEAALAVHEKQGSAEEATQTEGHHPDGTLQAARDQLMSRFIPFQPPPPPVPFGQATESQPASAIMENIATAPAQIKKRAWSTAVVVTESTDASGNRTYSATTAPMVEIEEAQEVEQPQPGYAGHQREEAEETEDEEAQVQEAHEEDEAVAKETRQTMIDLQYGVIRVLGMVGVRACGVDLQGRKAS